MSVVWEMNQDTVCQRKEGMSEKEKHRRMHALLIRVRNTGRIQGLGAEFLHAAIYMGWIEMGSNGRAYVTVSGRRMSGR